MMDNEREFKELGSGFSSIQTTYCLCSFQQKCRRFWNLIHGKKVTDLFYCSERKQTKFVFHLEDYRNGVLILRINVNYYTNKDLYRGQYVTKVIPTEDGAQGWYNFSQACKTTCYC